MYDKTLRRLLDDVSEGRVSASDAARLLQRLPFADLGFARVDHHRHLRLGFPEAVYAPSKSAAQCVAIVDELLHNGEGPVLLTRPNAEQTAAVEAVHPVDLRSETILAWRLADARPEKVLVVTAGTSDLSVADECINTLRALGFATTSLADVGVAGLHRLLASLDMLHEADAIVVVAGMEGALASVVGGLVAVPVVAVPTSTGYGSSFEGATALLAMTASCAAGVPVVGIDNGFGAACAIVRQFNRRPILPTSRTSSEETS